MENKMDNIIVEVLVDGSGSVITKVIGATGPSCTELTKPIEDLGLVTSRTKLPEYYLQRRAEGKLTR